MTVKSFGTDVLAPIRFGAETVWRRCLATDAVRQDGLVLICFDVETFLRQFFFFIEILRCCECTRGSFYTTVHVIM